MTSKHTPGPWRAEGWWVGDDSQNPITIATSAVRGDTGQANAKLIAAAPALAETVESFIAAGCGCSPREIDSGHKRDCPFPHLRDYAEGTLRAAGRLP